MDILLDDNNDLTERIGEASQQNIGLLLQISYGALFYAPTTGIGLIHKLSQPTTPEYFNKLKEDIKSQVIRDGGRNVFIEGDNQENLIIYANYN